MIGVPHFSKIEGTMMLIGAVGLLMSWATGSAVQFYCIVFQSAILMYFMICLIYFILVEQNVPVAISIILFSGGLISWRFIRFLNKATYANEIYIFAAVFSGIWALIAVKMIYTARGMQDVIKKFQQTEKYCAENPDFVWEFGKDAPNGFSFKK